jgi:4-hydroxy-tetrahydrodipicolinate synthase
MPSQTVEITKRWFAGDIKGAAELQFKFKQIVGALFSEVNPIPIKAALGLSGTDVGICRLPLTPPGEDLLERLKNAM